MADNFGLKIGLEGEKEFKKALSDINQSFKVLGSEMKVVQSQFDKNDDSVEALTSRNQVLGKEIDAQKKKIETLRQALENASVSFGENDRRTQQWQIQLNNAEAALNDMQRELDQNQQAIDSMGNEMRDAAQQTDKFGDEIDDAAERTSSVMRSMTQPTRPIRLPASWRRLAPSSRGWQSRRELLLPPPEPLLPG